MIVLERNAFSEDKHKIGLWHFLFEYVDEAPGKNTEPKGTLKAALNFAVAYEGRGKQQASYEEVNRRNQIETKTEATVPRFIRPIMKNWI